LAKGEKALCGLKGGGDKGGEGLLVGVVLVALGDNGEKVPDEGFERGERRGEVV